ncbi:MAG: GNAT family N-acetyltransferase [Planctomycetales bacterium]
MTLYSYRLAEGVAEIDQVAWESVCGPARHPFMDLRYLRAVETTFAAESRFWYATLCDGSGRVVGCTCFCFFLVDVGVLAPPRAQRLITFFRRWKPSFAKYRVLLGGSPVSTSGSQLVLVEGIDLERAAATLNAIADELARRCRAQFISFKEFDPELTSKMQVLEPHGYRRADSLVAHWLVGDFDSFDDYYNSRSKRTRANIRRHFRKLEVAGITWVHYRGRDGVERLFDERVHRLYLNVYDRSRTKFERLPPSFFAELARHLPDESCFTFMFQGETPVGFCCGVASPGAHTLLYCGLDYDLNAQADLYFNIIFRGLEQGLVPGVKTVHVGASADEFKQHMGCTQVPLSIYVKPRGWWMTFLFRRFFHVLFPENPAKYSRRADREID